MILSIGCSEEVKTTGCGNGICDSDETIVSCPDDCVKKATSCGNGTCDIDESITTCPEDCHLIPVCGNDICEPGEFITTCPKDCRKLCGNDICDPSETESTCLEDCGTCNDDPPRCAGDGTSYGYVCIDQRWVREDLFPVTDISLVCVMIDGHITSKLPCVGKKVGLNPRTCQPPDFDDDRFTSIQTTCALDDLGILYASKIDREWCDGDCFDSVCQPCPEGKMRCIGSVQKCENGAWVFKEHCPNGSYCHTNEFCTGEDCTSESYDLASCVPKCDPDSYKSTQTCSTNESGQSILVTTHCETAYYSSYVAESTEICPNGCKNAKCLPKTGCIEGEIACEGKWFKMCENGKWTTPNTCAYDADFICTTIDGEASCDFSPCYSEKVGSDMQICYEFWHGSYELIETCTTDDNGNLYASKQSYIKSCDSCDGNHCK